MIWTIVNKSLHFFQKMLNLATLPLLLVACTFFIQLAVTLQLSYDIPPIYQNLTSLTSSHKAFAKHSFTYTPTFPEKRIDVKANLINSESFTDAHGHCELTRSAPQNKLIARVELDLNRGESIAQVASVASNGVLVTISNLNILRIYQFSRHTLQAGGQQDSAEAKLISSKDIGFSHWKLISGTQIFLIKGDELYQVHLVGSEAYLIKISQLAHHNYQGVADRDDGMLYLHSFGQLILFQNSTTMTRLEVEGIVKIVDIGYNYSTVFLLGDNNLVLVDKRTQQQTVYSLPQADRDLPIRFKKIRVSGAVVQILMQFHKRTFVVELIGYDSQVLAINRIIKYTDSVRDVYINQKIGILVCETNYYYFKPGVHRSIPQKSEIIYSEPYFSRGIVSTLPITRDLSTLVFVYEDRLQLLDMGTLSPSTLTCNFEDTGSIKTHLNFIVPYNSSSYLAITQQSRIQVSRGLTAQEVAWYSILLSLLLVFCLIALLVMLTRLRRKLEQKQLKNMRLREQKARKQRANSPNREEVSIDILKDNQNVDKFKDQNSL